MKKDNIYFISHSDFLNPKLQFFTWYKSTLKFHEPFRISDLFLQKCTCQLKISISNQISSGQTFISALQRHIRELDVDIVFSKTNANKAII